MSLGLRLVRIVGLISAFLLIGTPVLAVPVLFDLEVHFTSPDHQMHLAGLGDTVYSNSGSEQLAVNFTSLMVTDSAYPVWADYSGLDLTLLLYDLGGPNPIRQAHVLFGGNSPSPSPPNTARIRLYTQHSLLNLPPATVAELSALLAADDPVAYFNQVMSGSPATFLQISYSPDGNQNIPLTGAIHSISLQVVPEPTGLAGIIALLGVAMRRRRCIHSALGKAKG